MMRIKKGHLVISILVGLLILAGCSDDQTGSSGDSQNRNEPGTVIFPYTYLVNSPPNIVILIQPDIPATFQRNIDNDAQYVVEGYIPTTAYMTLMGSNAGNDCLLQCDAPLLYHVNGKLHQNLNDGKLVCDIEVTFEAGFIEGADINVYGDCPATVNNHYPCKAILEAFLNPETVLFSKSPEVIPLSADQGVTHTAAIKDVVFPGDTACEW